ncbi:MAG: hypothetical protein OXC66_05300, partial [Roseovarius sp.]|nr:hypothetical protein [Roseovarius sp.]
MPRTGRGPSAEPPEASLAGAHRPCTRLGTRSGGDGPPDRDIEAGGAAGIAEYDSLIGVSLLSRGRMKGRAPHLGRTPRAGGRPLHGGIVGDDTQWGDEGALQETPGEADGRKRRLRFGDAEASRTLAEPSPDQPGRPGGRGSTRPDARPPVDGLRAIDSGPEKTAKKTKFPLDSKHGCFKVSR